MSFRYFFEIAYDGTNYHGWQRQNNARSIQQTVEEALSTILRTSITITGSGRTDTGVHCEQQYFHVDFEKKIDETKLLLKLNGLLPTDIGINAINLVGNDAHARFDAQIRKYEYRVTRKKSPFIHGYSFLYTKPLEVQTMNEAAALLVGKQDFEAFSKVKTEVNNFVCEIYEAQWVETNDLLTFHVSANRFLRGMVRALVGTLLDIGKGKHQVQHIKNIIESKDRKNAGAAAPACGLFLTRLKYPKETFK